MDFNLLPKVFRTEGDIAEFDPTKILNSVIDETGLNEEEAKKVTELTVRRIVSTGIKFLSGPHIREIVCSILSEQNYEQERKIYTRIGMPLMDYEKILEQSIKSNSNFINPEGIHEIASSRFSEEYSHLKILSEEESRSHLFGDFHIHNLNFFELKPQSFWLDPRVIFKHGIPPTVTIKSHGKLNSAEDLREALNHIILWLSMIKGEFSGVLGINFINVFLAPFVGNISDNQLKNHLLYFFNQLNLISLITSKKIPNIFISISPVIPALLENTQAISKKGEIHGLYKDYQNACFRLYNIFTDIIKDMEENNFQNPKFVIFFNKKWTTSKKNSYTKLISTDFSKYPLFLVNLDNMWINEKFLKLSQSNSFWNFEIAQEITLNLPRYAYTSKDKDNFLTILESKLELVDKIFLKKKELLYKRSNSGILPLSNLKINSDKIISRNEQLYAISFIGLNEKKILLLIQQHYKESPEQSLNIILKSNYSKGIITRFTELDRKHFPQEIKIVVPEKIYRYTNNLEVNLNKETALNQLLERESYFQSLIKGFFYVKVQNSKLTKETYPFIDLLQHICTKTDIGLIKLS
ncbi:MAG: anaerobic ribonucleoside-triphosphate reductase [Candidatus Lokiarchaeota archaeon]